VFEEHGRNRVNYLNVMDAQLNQSFLKTSYNKLKTIFNANENESRDKIEGLDSRVVIRDVA
jgi:uncharacterized protein (DUF1015 family)